MEATCIRQTDKVGRSDRPEGGRSGCCWRSAAASQGDMGSLLPLILRGNRLTLPLPCQAQGLLQPGQEPRAARSQLLSQRAAGWVAQDKQVLPKTPPIPALSDSH